MPSSCPICEQPIPATAAHCAVCGFPTGLAIEALRAIRSSEPAVPTEPTVGARSSDPPRRPRATPPPEAELSAAVGRGLRERMEALRPLGRDAPDVTSELCEAALSEAAGRVSEGLETLRAAQGRLERQTREAIRRRIDSVEERRSALERTGIQLDLEGPMPAIESVTDPAATLHTLVEVERRIAKFESDWKGLQGLLSQIEALRSEADDLGVPLEEIPAEIERVREKISAGSLRETDLDSLAQDAARTLMLLHDVLPTALSEELARHQTTLDALPDDLKAANAARRMHEEALRHVEKGRLTAATQSVRDLRRTLTEIEQGPSAPKAAPPPVTAPAIDPAVLDTLLKKARSLAVRVRTLSTDSPLALEAAALIREATDHLKQGRLIEADRTLTDLMRSLAREEGRA